VLKHEYGICEIINGVKSQFLEDYLPVILAVGPQRVLKAGIFGNRSAGGF